MSNSKIITTTAVFLTLFATSAYANSVKPVPVVASFSILGDMVKRIGAEHVSITTLVGPNGDTHVYQPTPADARAVRQAKLLFVNGLKFEGWIERLVEASGFKGTRIVTTEGIKPIPYEDAHDEHHKDEHGKEEHHKDEHHKDEHGKEEHHKDEHHKHEHGKEERHKDEHHKGEHRKEAHHKDEHGHEQKHADADRHKNHDGDKDSDHDGHDHGAFDPHAWQSLKNAVNYVDNITAALAKVDPVNAATFYGNRAAYVAEILSLDAEIRKTVAGLPTNRRTVVTSHDAFQYFGRDFGLTFLAPQGLSTEAEASAKDVAQLIRQMREKKISAVFVENITDPRLLKQIANETGAAIGGTLYPGALSGHSGPAATYLDMIRHNATTLVESLKP
jgi:zinc/manganese transport system substrate-binding protein